MSFIRKFDFFQKISVDNITQPTLVGSFLSVSAISIMIFLLVKEIISFFSPTIIKQSLVSQDKDIHSKLDIHLGIRFPNVPCHLISVDQEDSIGNHRLDIRDTITKTRLNNIGNIITEPFTGYKDLLSFIEALNNSEGCFISGFVSVVKVKGDIHISFHNYADLYRFLQADRRELYEKILMNHKIQYLNFGEINSNDAILERFELDEVSISHKNIKNSNKISNGFNNPSNLPNFINESKRQNYDYYIKLIPYIFDDKINENKQRIGYQFSMTSRSREFTEGQMPIVMLNYDFSPISMKFNLERKSFLHFLTHVCAIIGGVFVIFNILNSLLIGIYDFSNPGK